jgi:hypothetical protein
VKIKGVRTKKNKSENAKFAEKSGLEQVGSQEKRLKTGGPALPRGD